MCGLALNAARESGADLAQWRCAEGHESNSAPSRELPEGFFRAELEREYFCPTGIRRGEDCNFSLVAYARAKNRFCLGRSLCRYGKTRQSAITRNSLAAESLLAAAGARKKACELAKERLQFNEDFGIFKKNRKKYPSFFLTGRRNQSQAFFLFCQSLTCGFFALAFLSLTGASLDGFERKNKKSLYIASCRLAFGCARRQMNRLPARRRREWGLGAKS